MKVDCPYQNGCIFATRGPRLVEGYAPVYVEATLLMLQQKKKYNY